MRFDRHAGGQHPAGKRCNRTPATHQFLDDEVEQHLPRGQSRPGQCENIMAQPLRERAYVAGEAGRLALGLPREIQLDGKLGVRTVLASAVGPVLHPLAA